MNRQFLQSDTGAEISEIEVSLVGFQIRSSDLDLVSFLQVESVEGSEQIIDVLVIHLVLGTVGLEREFGLAQLEVDKASLVGSEVIGDIFTFDGVALSGIGGSHGLKLIFGSDFSRSGHLHLFIGEKSKLSFEIMILIGCGILIASDQLRGIIISGDIGVHLDSGADSEFKTGSASGIGGSKVPVVDINSTGFIGEEGSLTGSGSDHTLSEDFLVFFIFSQSSDLCDGGIDDGSLDIDGDIGADFLTVDGVFHGDGESSILEQSGLVSIEGHGSGIRAGEGGGGKFSFGQGSVVHRDSQSDDIIDIMSSFFGDDEKNLMRSFRSGDSSPFSLGTGIGSVASIIGSGACVGGTGIGSGLIGGAVGSDRSAGHHAESKDR